MRLSNVLLNMFVCVRERERERSNRNEFRNEKTFPSTQTHIIQRHFLPHQLLMSHINQFSNSQFCSFLLSLSLSYSYTHTISLYRLHRQTHNIYQCFCLPFFLHLSAVLPFCLFTSQTVKCQQRRNIIESVGMEHEIIFSRHNSFQSLFFIAKNGSDNFYCCTCFSSQKKFVHASLLNCLKI